MKKAGGKKKGKDMFSYEAVKGKTHLFQTMTGVTREEFETILEAFTKAWAAYVKRTASEKKNRQRGSGGGRKPVLRTAEDKLLFILYYLKVYPLQEILAFEFGMSQGQACKWIHVLAQVLQETFTQLGTMPEQRPARLEGVLKKTGEDTFIIDGTERRRQRPKDKSRQRKYYSGKKKRTRSRIW